MEICYDIATEGFNINSMKARINRAFETAKRFLQNALNAIKSVIAKLMNKFFKTATFEVNREYYNEVIQIIHKVQALDLSFTDKVKSYISAVNFDYDKITEIYTKMSNRLDDLKDLETRAGNVKPSSYGPTVTLTESHFAKMRNDFTQMQQIYLAEIGKNATLHDMIISILNKAGIDEKTLKGEHTVAELVDLIYSIIIRNSRINLMRANLLISLVGMITKNRLSEEDKKANMGYKDVKFREVSNKSSNNQPENNKVLALPMNESLTKFIDFCDDYQITNESLIKAKRIYNSRIKGIKENDYDISNYPDNTVVEIKEKLKIINEQRGEIKDLISDVKSEKAGIVDRLISGAAILSRAALTIVNLIVGKELSADITHGDLSASRLWKKIGIIMGSKYASGLLKKASISNRQEFINDLLRDLRKRDRQLIQLESVLNNKLNSLK